MLELHLPQEVLGELEHDIFVLLGKMKGKTREGLIWTLCEDLLLSDRHVWNELFCCLVKLKFIPWLPFSSLDVIYAWYYI